MTTLSGKYIGGSWNAHERNIHTFCYKDMIVNGWIFQRWTQQHQNDWMDLCALNFWDDSIVPDQAWEATRTQSKCGFLHGQASSRISSESKKCKMVCKEPLCWWKNDQIFTVCQKLWQNLGQNATKIHWLTYWKIICHEQLEPYCRQWRKCSMPNDLKSIDFRTLLLFVFIFFKISRIPE